MAQRKNPFRNIQVEVQKSPRTLKVVLAILIVFCMVTLLALSWVRSGIQNRTDALQDKAAELEQENADLEDKIGKVGSVEGIQNIAKEELGLADPNTIIINPTQP